jgi:amidase
MGVTGPMARSVRDLALLLAVQAGYDARAPLSLESSGAQFEGPLGTDPRGKRIAWAGDFRGFVPYEAGVLDACREALKSFEALGCHVEEACPDYPVDKVWDSFVKLRGWQQGGALLDHYRNPARRELLKPEARYEVEQGLALSAFDVTAHSVIRTEWTQAVREFFRRYDFWVMPTAQTFPFTIDQHWPTEIAGRKMQSYHEWMKAVCLVTMSGCPSLAAPAGFGKNGLPMGIQIIAPVHADIEAVRLAHAYEVISQSRISRPPPMLLRA